VGGAEPTDNRERTGISVVSSLGKANKVFIQGDSDRRSLYIRHPIASVCPSLAVVTALRSALPYTVI
jgi:hypothetical protein